MNSVRRSINLIHFPFVFLSSLAAFLLLITIFAAPQAARAATTCPTSGHNITISTNCSFDAGTYNFTGALTVNSGVTVTANSNIGNAAVIINTDDILINGAVSANGAGFAAGNGPGAGGTFSNSGGGGGYGGNGGFVQASGVTYGSATFPIDLGSGGGSTVFVTGTGSGGGAIKIVASGTLTVNGSVTANGANGNTGGGSGGSVWLEAGILSGTGMVTTNGGTGSDNGGGGGGRVALKYTADSSSFSAVSAFGGIGVGGTNGGAGTIFRKVAAAINGDLLVDNNNLPASANTTQAGALSQTYDNVTIRNGVNYVIPNTFGLSVAAGGALTGGGSVRPSITVNIGGTLNSPSSTLTISQMDITNGGSFGVVTNLALTNSTFGHGGTFIAGLANLTVGSFAAFEFRTLATLAVTNNVTIQNGGTLKHTANIFTQQLFSVNLSTQNFIVDAGGAVNANGAGFSVNNGPGAGGTFSNSGCGGGYGGIGGEFGFVGCGGVTYGSSTAPTDLGSGGGFTGTGSGGGAIKIVAPGTLTVNGSITANGATGNTGGGGSGGSVLLDAGTLTGIGAITANGGNSFNFGCGGGGRIALYASTFSHSGSVAVNNTCPNGVPGGAGTIFQQQTGDTTAPTVGAMAPTTAVVNMATTFSVIYSDNAGVNSCNFFADNIDQGIMTLSAPGGTIGIATMLHTYTSTGAHTAQVKCKDAVGNVGTSALTTVIVVDTTAPTITSAVLTPSIVGTIATITITKTVTDNVAVSSVTAVVQGPSPSISPVGTVTLTLSGGTAQNGTWSGSFTFPAQGSAPDGTYTVVDTATDTSGNPVTVVDGTVILDRTAPTLSIISINPLVAKPGTTVTVRASVQDTTSGISSMTLRDATLGSAPATMTLISGSTFAGATSQWGGVITAALPEGPHTAEVTSKDNAAPPNSNIVTNTFTVDATPPDTIIDTIPPSLSTSADAIFTFHATESPATFECQLDGGGLASCVSPKPYIGLAGGSHTFNVRATDEAGNTDPTPASFTWTINRPPVANPDSYTTNEDITLTVPATGVLANDTDVDGNALTAVLGASPSNGMLTLNANGSFTYTPNANFFGTDTFAYQAKDSPGATSNLALVTITVNDVPEPVVVIGGVLVSSVINADGSLTVTVIGTGQGRTYTTILPAGTAPLAPNTSIVITVIDTNAKRAKFKVEATLPAGASKTMTVPRSTGRRACVQDVSGGIFNMGGGCPSANRVTIPVAGSSCTSPSISCSNLPLGATISTSVDNTQVTVNGLKHSVVEIVGDTDGDGVDDDEDQCLNDVGSAATIGCPSAIMVLFQRHTVQSGTRPGSAKTPVVGATVNIYSKTAGSCAATIGISPKNYKTIYEGNPLNGSNDLDGPCIPDQSRVTDLTGNVTIGVLSGDYITISKDPVTNVFAGVSVGTVISGQVAKKFIQVIVRADGTAVSAKTTQNSGSVLYTIEPEYIDWTGTQQLYPYVFDSEGVWDVIMNLTPPYGFIADYSSLTTVVNSEYKALQFTLTNTGSCWECGLDVEVIVKHEGKTKKWKSNVRSDISEEYAKKKGLDLHELEKKGVVVTGKGHGDAKKKDEN